MGEVAARAGVSKTAVSFAFNAPTRLSEGTLRHILEVADELGYVRDPAARMLRTRQAHAIGLLVPQDLPDVLANPYFAHFMGGIGQVCAREGLSLLVVPPLAGSMLEAIPSAAVDGFVVSGLDTDRGELRALRRRGSPFVLVDSDEMPGVSWVGIDDYQGARSVMEFVLSQGHREIALLVLGSRSDPGGRYPAPVQRRLAGAIAALETSGLSLKSRSVRLVEVLATHQAGGDAFRRLWAARRRPTAVVAFSDIVAIGAMHAARDLGVDVPGQVSIAGFDDIAEAQWVHPALTTVHQPIEAKGRLAAEYLVDTVAAGGTVDVRRPLLHVALVVRDSVGPVPDEAG